ncbi:DUF2062 domain-containing protein [Pelosinus sp. sgz500959]|uniref:DUF2062 domain-containing protein n=1 Tax=Pelosinus sp. sgz500959 TaxID=3242472 RepID=UPI003671C083
MRKRVWRLVQIHWKRLLMLRGDRRAIARGIALGVSINFIPTIGLGPPLVYWIARMINGHRASALVSTMGVKAFVPLLYLLNYIVGELFLKQRLAPILSWNGVMDASSSLFIGGAINFTVAFIIIYYLVLQWIGRRRDHLFTRQHVRHDFVSKRNN